MGAVDHFPGTIYGVNNHEIGCRSLLPAVLLDFGTREDYPHNRCSECLLESEEPPKPPPALLGALCGLLSLSAGVGGGGFRGRLGRFCGLLVALLEGRRPRRVSFLYAFANSSRQAPF